MYSFKKVFSTCISNCAKRNDILNESGCVMRNSFVTSLSASVRANSTFLGNGKIAGSPQTNDYTKTKDYEKRNYCVKRKFPLNPSHAEELPIFDYAKSKKGRLNAYAWGYAQTGALGCRLKEINGGITELFRFPKRLTFAEYNEVVDAATGFGFTAFVVKENGQHRLYGTGLNTDSQIGYHLAKNKKHLDILLLPHPINLQSENFDHQSTPEITNRTSNQEKANRPSNPENTTHGSTEENSNRLQILKVAAGRAHMLVLTQDGLFTLGNNAYGQCGRQIIENENYNGSQVVHQISAIQGERIVNVEAGQDHSFAITETGRVYGTGWGADGQTGLEHYNTVSSFTKVMGDIKSENIVKIACTSDFVLALNDKGEVFGWGNTEYGQIPPTEITNDVQHDQSKQFNQSQQCSRPTFLEMCKSLGKIKDIAAGGTSCMVLNEEGHVFVWGFGLLGLGPEATQSSKPVQLVPALFGLNDFNPNTRVVSVAAGLFHMAAVTDNGELYMWGRNKCGCLGFGNDKPQNFPLKVSIGGSVKKILCSADHTVALCTPYG